MNNQLLFKMLEGQNIDNKYYLNKLLGSGGFGGVYLADEVVRDRLIRTVALKLIITDNPDKQLDELIFSTTLNHPNLISCFTCGECNLNGADFLYLLMEQADYSLEDELKKGKLSEEKVKELVLDITNGLDYLHTQKPVIVHRDLKPGNILRVGDKWKISDFGLVRSLKNTATQTSTISGTIAYAPPEAYDGNISPAWDIWSLGVVIYESLTGKLPFNGDSLFKLMRQVADLEPDVRELSIHWQGIVKSCLEKEGKQRSTTQVILQGLSTSTSEKQVITNNNNISELPYFYNNPFKCIPPEPNISHFSSVNSVAISRDGITLVSGSLDKTIKIWDLHSGQLLCIHKGHSHPVKSVAISEDGNVIVSGSVDQTIQILDRHSGLRIFASPGHSDWVNSVAISKDGNIIVSGSWDKSIKIWDRHSGKLLRTLEDHFDLVHSVAISRDGNVIVSGSGDKTIKIWNRHSGKLLRTFKGHCRLVKSVAISEDCSTIISGSDDKTIKIWDRYSGKLLRTFEGHSDSVNSLSISGDGNVLVSSSDDKTIKIWDVHSGNLLQTIKMEGFLENGVNWIWVANQVIFSPDDKQIIAGCSDGTIKIWDV